MSQRAVNWALEQVSLKSGPWRVLVMLADRHNKDTLRCDPHQSRLAADCNMSRATLNRHLDELEEEGLIQRIKREDPATRRPMSTFYILGLDRDNPPEVEFAVSQNETWDFEGENENETDSHVSNRDTESVSQKTAVPCLKNDDSRVSLLRHKPVIKPKREPYAGACAGEEKSPDAAKADLDAIAENWVDPVKAGRGWCGSAISLPVARHMLKLGLVTETDLRAVGVKF